MLALAALVLLTTPAPTCAGCAADDQVWDDGRVELVLGASSRVDECFYSFPTANLRGALVRFRPASLPESAERLMVGTPYLRVNDATMHLDYTEVSAPTPAAGAPFRAEARARYEGADGARIAVVTRYTVPRGRGRVEMGATFTNAGTTPLRNQVFALFFDPHQMYDYSPADVAGHEDQKYRVYPRPGHYLAWLDRNPRRVEPRQPQIWDGSITYEPPAPVDLAPGQSHTVHYLLLTAKDPATLQKDLYAELGQAVFPVEVAMKSSGADPVELVVREPGGAVYFRSFLASALPVALALPRGTYVAEAHFFPAVVTRTFSIGGPEPTRVALTDPPKATVRVTLRDAEGHAWPGKVTFLGLDGTPSPFFRTTDPVQGARYWESFRNSVFPPAEGSDVSLPPGRYEVVGSHGPRFSIDSRVLDLRAGRSESIDLRIAPVVSTPGWVAVDPHVHSLVSDGSVDVAGRVQSLAAEGIDVAMATEHNHPFDWSPTVARLGLASQLGVIVGAEVTVPDRLDFNTYPMKIETDKPNGGALNSRSTDIASLFEQARRRDPGVIVQSNHPRGSEYDYLTWHELDPNDAGRAREGLDLSFDVLEVVNGPRLEAEQNVKAKRDWLNLLRRGFYRPLVGSSDAHEIDRDEPGYSRTYVRYDGPAGKDVDARALVEAMRAGHSFASNGPFVTFTVNGSAGPGDTLMVRDGRVTVTVDVRSPEWARVDEIHLFVNGEDRRLETRLVSTSPARHLQASVDLHLERDTYLAVQASGQGTLFPVVQASPDDGVAPYALTNPVFVDVDGNGAFDPPLPHRIEFHR